MYRSLKRTLHGKSYHHNPFDWMEQLRSLGDPTATSNGRIQTPWLDLSGIERGLPVREIARKVVFDGANMPAVGGGERSWWLPELEYPF